MVPSSPRGPTVRRWMSFRWRTVPSGASAAPICATPPQTIASENRLAISGMWFRPFSTGRMTVSERM
jgi:hypothetical protein